MRLADAFGERIQIADKADDWKEAIEMVIQPLVKDGYAESRYIPAIYRSVEKNGDYFLLAPEFALPHTRPEEGCLKTGLSLLKLRTPVKFSGGDPVRLLIGLTAADASEHIDMLGELADILMDEEKMEKLFEADTAGEFMEIFR